MQFAMEEKKLLLPFVDIYIITLSVSAVPTCPDAVMIHFDYATDTFLSALVPIYVKPLLLLR
jgi:hypothetical protein